MNKIKSIAEKLFKDTSKDFDIRDWKGNLLGISKDPKFILIFNDKNTFKEVLLRPDPYYAGKAYVDKRLDIEGDLYEAIKFGDELPSIKLSMVDKVSILGSLLTL